VAEAAEQRRREFLSGRAAARRALARLGVHGHDLLVGEARAPRWPPGIAGSISHGGGVCVAAAALRERHAGIGVDCEPDEPLAEKLWPRIATAAELDCLARLPAEQRGNWARRLFCAKECYYKYQRPQTGRFLGFDDVEIDFDEGIRGFTVRDRTARGAPVRGGWRRSAGRIVCAIPAQAGE
jgi:4'-phosphopantetheinyl transferase EntD